MRIVIQRVRQASVSVDGREVASINQGLLALVGFSSNDADTSFKKMADKLINLRIFDDKNGRLNLSLIDVQGQILLVPQITLTASLAKGHRPSFHTSALPEIAKKLFDQFARVVKDLYPHVQTGQFQSSMVVSLQNDGPVTFSLDC